MILPQFTFRPRLLSVFRDYSFKDFVGDLAAGITVGIVALPLAMAFAIASGLKPEAGIYTAIVAGFLISALGGSKVQIGGPAGAFIVIVYGIVAQYGIDGLIISTILAGILLFLMGFLRWGSLIRFVPVSIVIGFTNGIAVLIALSQVKDLLGLKIDKLPSDFFPKMASLAGHLDTISLPTIALSLVSLAIVFTWPVFVRKSGLKFLQYIPSSIVALVLGTAAVSFLNLPVETIGTQFGGIPSALPEFVIPTIDLATIKNLIQPTITIAMLGAIESLLCARVADGLSGDKHDPNQELMAQGIANIAAPMLGGYSATGTIARTVTNIRMGGKTPIAGITHALTLLAIIAVAAPLAKNVPLATLGAILLFVAYNMGEWHEFVRLRHFTNYYRIILLTVFALTVIIDLTVAIEVGLGLALLFFVARMSSVTRLEPVPEIEAEGHAHLNGGIEAYRLYGSLFFGAVHRLEELSDPSRKMPKFLILNIGNVVNLDTSGLDELKSLFATLKKKHCRLLIAEAKAQPLSMMKRGTFIKDMGEENFFPTMAEALEYAAAALKQKVESPPVF
ncbi:MAG: sulfate permease [Alphaproteobacteria bacterium]|nr:sulfate permease [Alphaproteobacteria bacterium]